MENLYVNFLAYAGTGLAMLLIGLFIFDITTKNKEFKMIGEGNKAAAMVIGGKLLGLAFVVGSAMAHSVSLLDMVIWGAIGIVAQVIVYFLAELLTVKFNIEGAIAEDNQAVAKTMFFISLSIGWVIAQALTY